MKIRAGDPRRGVAVVELAVLLPFLAFMLVIAYDWGRIFYFSVTLTNVARNGAVYASDPIFETYSPYTSIQQAALAETTNMNPQPTITSTNGVDGSGNPYVDVTAQWKFSTVSNFPGVPQNTTLSRTVRVRVAPTTPK
jgi:Flp pilus assembly protein TadG